MKKIKTKKTREIILDTSLMMFNEKKSSNISTVKISHALEISPGNLYYYFENKEEIIKCLWEERMRPLFESNLETLSSINTVKDMISFIEEMFSFMIAHRFFYTERSTLFANDEELVKTYSYTKKQARNELNDFVKKMIKEGLFIKDEAFCNITLLNANAVAVDSLSEYDKLVETDQGYRKFMEAFLIRVVACLMPLFEEEARTNVENTFSARQFSYEYFLSIIG